MIQLKNRRCQLFFIITYLMIFGGAARLYYHYFMPAYIPLSLIASIVIFNDGEYNISFIRKKMKVLFLIPAVFFILWNTKDIIIKHCAPQGFYNEGKIMFWTRAVLMGRYNTYLLPHPDYRDAAEYIRKTTMEGDRIFVWGNGPEIYYFSRRRMGVYTLWPKAAIYQISKLYKAGDPGSLKKIKTIEKHFLDLLKNKKPVIVIDSSGNTSQQVTEMKLLRPAYFDIPVTVAPGLYAYLVEHYKLEKIINEMKIYRRK